MVNSAVSPTSFDSSTTASYSPSVYVDAPSRGATSPSTTFEDNVFSITTNAGINMILNQLTSSIQRKGVTFNLLLLGENGIGKTTFLNTLFNISPDTYKNTINDDIIELNKEKEKEKNKELSSLEIEIEIGLKNSKYLIEQDNIELIVNVTESKNFGNLLNNNKSIPPIIDFIDQQLSSYVFQEEQLNRIGLINDTRIHACIYFIGRLTRFDIKAMKLIGQKVNLIPVIAKGDECCATNRHNNENFKIVTEAIRDSRIKVYQWKLMNSNSTPFPDLAEDLKLEINNNIDLDNIFNPTTSYIDYSPEPYIIIGSNEYHTITSGDHIGEIIRARKPIWCHDSLINVNDPNISDTPRLRDLLFKTDMADMIDYTERVIYEKFRSKLYIERLQIYYEDFEKYSNNGNQTNLNSSSSDKQNDLCNIFNNNSTIEETLNLFLKISKIHPFYFNNKDYETNFNFIKKRNKIIEKYKNLSNSIENENENDNENIKNRFRNEILHLKHRIDISKCITGDCFSEGKNVYDDDILEYFKEVNIDINRT